VSTSPRRCPRCQGALTIPTPLPERIQCPACAAVIRLAPAGAAAPAAAPAGSWEGTGRPTEADPPTANGKGRGGVKVAVAVVALLLLVGVGVGGFLLLGGGSPPQVADDDGPPEEEQPLSPPPRPDPRLKIVQPAVDRGVASLRAQLKAGNLAAMDQRIAKARVGIASLIGLTLLECGARPDDLDVESVAGTLRAEGASLHETYVISAALLFLNRLDEARKLDAKDRALARRLALQLVLGQTPSGRWGYTVPEAPSPVEEAKLLETLRSETFKPAHGTSTTVSNTQFAMLALWGARKHGVPVKSSLLALAGSFRGTQLPPGSWQYAASESGVLHSTSTCAALIALAMEKALLEDREFVSAKGRASAAAQGAGEKVPDLEKGFSYVAQSIGRKRGDPGGASHGYVGTYFQADSWGDTYFLWSVERLAMIYDRPKIGGKDWYDWGYRVLLEKQQPDGSWSDRHGPAVDTCFALLFLKRANLAKDLTNKLRDLMRRGVSAPPRPPGPAAPGPGKP
jgi:hypothetical protein